MFSRVWREVMHLCQENHQDGTMSFWVRCLRRFITGDVYLDLLVGLMSAGFLLCKAAVFSLQLISILGEGTSRRCKSCFSWNFCPLILAHLLVGLICKNSYHGSNGNSLFPSFLSHLLVGILWGRAVPSLLWFIYLIMYIALESQVFIYSVQNPVLH